MPLSAVAPTPAFASQPRPSMRGEAAPAPLIGCAPSWAAGACGAWLWDAHGQRRLDLSAAGGALLFGHADPDIARAVERADPRCADRAAAALLDAAPTAEAVRFAADGDVLLAAAVLACRRLAGREAVHEVRTAEAAADAPAALAKGDVAALVIDPAALPRGLVHALRALVAAAGALIVFDERWSGLRRDAGGLQGALGVRADLTIFGPHIADGRALAAAAGSRALVEALPALAPPRLEALTAAAETLHKAAAERPALAIAVRGAELSAELAGMLAAAGADGFARLEGDPSAFRLVLDHPDARGLERRFAAQLAARGVHGGLALAPTAAFGDAEVDFALDAWGAALPTLVRAAAGRRSA